MKHLLTFLLALNSLSFFANDLCSNAISLTPSTACNYTTGSLNGASISTPAPSCASSSAQDVWYSFVATDPQMSVALGSNFGLNHAFEILTGSCTGSSLICVNNNGSGSSEFYQATSFVVGQTYYVRVLNAASGLSTLNFTICVQIIACTPTISINASNSNICLGETVSFVSTITNGGTAPFYQWKKNGINVGSNSSSYADNTLANGDQISCVLTSNAICVSTPISSSNTITIAVNNPVTPTITIFSNNLNVCEGESVLFNSAITNGGSSPFYQWKKNGLNVGTNTSSLLISGLNNSDLITCVLVSSLTCVVGNQATSNAMSANVTTIDTTVFVNGSILSSNQAIGFYQWLDCSDFSPISGATGITFGPTFSGLYAVQLYVNGCVDTSECVLFSTITLSENELNEIVLFPNPASDYLTIQFPEYSKTIELTIYDQTGRLVSKQLVNESNSINIESLQIGSYIIELESLDSKAKKVFQFIKL